MHQTSINIEQNSATQNFFAKKTTDITRKGQDITMNRLMLLLLTIVCVTTVPAQQQHIRIPSSLSSIIKKQLERAASNCSDCSYKWIDDEHLEVTLPDSNTTLINLHDGTELMRAYTTKYPNMKVIEIDVDAYDTARYGGQMKLLSVAPISVSWFPAVFLDSDGNGLIEACGQYYVRSPNIQPNQVRMYEANDNQLSNWTLRYVFDSLIAMPRLVGDFNSNGRPEIVMDNYKSKPLEIASVYNLFEAKDKQSLATDSIYWIPHFYGGNVNFPKIADLDNDGKKDFLCRTFEPRPLDKNSKTYLEIFEYDSVLNQPVLVWKEYFRPTDKEGSFASFEQISIQDADENGKKEFLLTTPQRYNNMGGEVFIAEWTGIDNDYRVVWQDSLPMYNAYSNAATSDLNGDGRSEYYIVGTLSDYKGSSTRVIRIEATGENQYEPSLMIILRGVDGFNHESIGEIDYRGDGRKELAFTGANTALILKPVGIDSFSIVWVKKFKSNGGIGCSAQDLTFDGKDEMLIGVLYPIPEVGSPENNTLIFSYDSNYVLDVKNEHCINDFNSLLNVFPTISKNRFSIEYMTLTNHDIVITITDILGRVVRSFQRDAVQNATTIIWDGTDTIGQTVNQGIYIVHTQSRTGSLLKKILLFR